MPQFVIAELQAIADSSDKLRRNRGRRGLDILNRLRSDPKVDLMIYDRELPEFAGQPVDQKLVLLAKHLEGKVVTNDYNLNKVAKLHNVGVINLNDIANSLKPVFLPGEAIEVRIVEAGRGSRAGRRLPGRRHDGRHRRRPRPRRRAGRRDRHQRAANQRRPHGLRPLRSHCCRLGWPSDRMDLAAARQFDAASARRRRSRCIELHICCCESMMAC